MKAREPEFQDQVKHKTSKENTTGIVIAKYKFNGNIVLDVRSSDDKIYYSTPAKNWIVTKEYNPNEYYM